LAMGAIGAAQFARESQGIFEPPNYDALLSLQHTRQGASSSSSSDRLSSRLSTQSSITDSHGAQGDWQMMSTQGAASAEPWSSHDERMYLAVQYSAIRVTRTQGRGAQPRAPNRGAPRSDTLDQRREDGRGQANSHHDGRDDRQEQAQGSSRNRQESQYGDGHLRNGRGGRGRGRW
jgi:hypothetical protein